MASTANDNEYNKDGTRKNLKKSRTLLETRKGMVECVVAFVMALGSMAGNMSGFHWVAQIIMASVAMIAMMLVLYRFVLVGMFRKEDHNRRVR